MFTLTYVDLDMKPKFLFGNDDGTKIVVLISFQLGTRLNSQSGNETGFISGL